MAEEVVDNMKHCYENLILIDVGANLTNKKYSRDLDAVIQRAQDSGNCTVEADTNESELFCLCAIALLRAQALPTNEQMRYF